MHSLHSLFNNTSGNTKIELLLGIDQDDTDSTEWFNSEEFSQYCVEKGVECVIWQTPRLGYLNLNQYVNHLATQASGTHLMFWNDDAEMLTKGWDKHIHQNAQFFGCLRMTCDNQNHPFALFPIIPQKWIEVFDCVSPVNHSDWWIYHVTHSLNRMINIPVHVIHNRSDVNGENADQTFADNSYALDGQSPWDIRDYSHPQRRQDLIDWQTTLMLYGYPHKRK